MILGECSAPYGLSARCPCGHANNFDRQIPRITTSNCPVRSCSGPDCRRGRGKGHGCRGYGCRTLIEAYTPPETRLQDTHLVLSQAKLDPLPLLGLVVPPNHCAKCPCHSTVPTACILLNLFIFLLYFPSEYLFPSPSFHRGYASAFERQIQRECSKYC